jgi:Ca2+-binding RTX toxin-like protein
MDGGYGDDIYFVDSTDDALREGGGDLLLSAIGGHDKVYASAHYSIDEGSPANLGKLALEDLILTGIANLNGIGNSSNNTIAGNPGNNMLRGNAGNDTVYGAAGNDILYGEGGADTLRGESGNDLLIGGAGNDNLSGGSGDDRYRFLFLSEKVDSISDFSTVLGNRDYVEVKASSFGADSLAQFSFNPSTLTLSFLNTPFATINNQNFVVNSDLQLI